MQVKEKQYTEHRKMVNGLNIHYTDWGNPHLPPRGCLPVRTYPAGIPTGSQSVRRIWSRKSSPNEGSSHRLTGVEDTPKLPATHGSPERTNGPRQEISK